MANGKHPFPWRAGLPRGSRVRSRREGEKREAGLSTEMNSLDPVGSGGGRKFHRRRDKEAEVNRLSRATDDALGALWVGEDSFPTAI